MQEVFDFPVSPKYGFDNFIICDGNRAAYTFARRLADGAGTENLLYLHGPPGSGKTHLLMALGASLYGPDADVRYFSFKEVDRLYQGDYPPEEVSNLAAFFSEGRALLIDDIHLIPDNKHVRSELWQVFNDFYGAGRPIAIAGSLPPKELPHMDEHLVSRLLWGLVAKMDVSDDESRRMIIGKLAADRHIRVPDDVVDYLIFHTRRDIPSLLHSFDTILRSSLSCKRRITLRLVRETLEREP